MHQEHTSDGKLVQRPMARIWPVYDGKRPTSGDQWAEVPLQEAVSLFELRQDQFVSGIAMTPRFGDADRDFTWAGYRHIVIEIDAREAPKAKWKAGFYRSKIRPQEAFRRLVQQTIVSALGGENVVRVECAETVDSLGEPALRVTVVLTPGAPARLAPASVVEASMKLKHRLREMHTYSTPLIEYATEAELDQDAAP
ncbi:MAG TPA: hypothetical protein VE907_11550 [Gammaproteobacteria bacterium]|nr:hypothetical protein [Gammaproteobacteria bacterium]